MGRTENISQTGVLLRGIRLFSPNDRVEILLTVPAGIVPGAAGEMLFIGKVARLLPPPIGGGLPGIAIAFEKYRPAGSTMGVMPTSSLPPNGPR
jgi:hypothetical protein